MNQYIELGEKYLLDCVFDGLAHSYDVKKEEYVKPYPEVTGYVIKYFCDNNKYIAQMKVAADYLLEIQDEESGGWSSFYNLKNLYAFDTAQILNGLCALYKKNNEEKYLEAAIRGGNFLMKMQMGNGAFIPIYNREIKESIIDARTYGIWNGPFSGLMCKLTEAYQALYEVTGNQEYLDRKELTASFYCNAEYIECTHPMGYWLEGLFEAGKYEKVDEILKKYVIPRIRENGYIPYMEELPYAYVSGVIQLGIILEKMGYRNEAQQIRAYGRCVQANHTSGGLFQYATEDGQVDSHVHTEINSWGTKYFCELERALADK